MQNVNHIPSFKSRTFGHPITHRIDVYRCNEIKNIGKVLGRFRSFFKVIVNVLILQSILYLSIFWSHTEWFEMNKEEYTWYKIWYIQDGVVHKYANVFKREEETTSETFVQIYNNNIVLDPFLVFFILTFRHSSPHLVWHIFYNIQMVSLKTW